VDLAVDGVEKASRHFSIQNSKIRQKKRSARAAVAFTPVWSLAMPRITAIETAIPRGIMSNLLLVRVHSDDGLVGCGETSYNPRGIAALIDDWMAARLLGADPLAMESHWRWLYERCTLFGHPGAEMRAATPKDAAQ
jgi:hypothetical protein